MNAHAIHTSQQWETQTARGSASKGRGVSGLAIAGSLTDHEDTEGRVSPRTAARLPNLVRGGSIRLLFITNAPGIPPGEQVRRQLILPAVRRPRTRFALSAVVVRAKFSRRLTKSCAHQSWIVDELGGEITDPFHHSRTPFLSLRFQRPNRDTSERPKSWKRQPIRTAP